MKAVMKTAPKQGFEFAELPVPKPGPKEILVKVKATSICGTDVHITEWDEWAQNRIKPPLLYGHEFAGEVVEKGGNAEGVEVGDFVSAETHVYCGHCFQCQTGNAHICENVKILGVDINGCFAEYAAIPASNAWKNSKKINPKHASAQEPLGNAVHTVSYCNVRDANVAIFGMGPIGLCAVQVCKAYGARKVIAVNPGEYRRKLAEKNGADLVLNPKEDDVVKEIMDATDGRGSDVLIEMSGSPQGITQGFESLRPGGEVGFLGIPPKPFEFDWSKNVVFKGCTIHGVNGRKIWDTWYRSRSLLESGKVDLGKIVTHELRLSDFAEGIELMKKGECGKIVMTP
ncbi:L-threonine 3-dehydrogenase [Candidatus Micrarchaeota archaeon CG_4_10_14_0_2_um_filter_60_11]|nr:MAG: L-threonine 3-dehydrogenase [Candidatus Micrarchaeota archaeon CG1_02_60_51]PIN96559.1 MAG: L-threonine 3-dehydrogenase [Candidatus Micrarchaeota archaeon CG10_big_fil_rev_8_21_14_0_10_60_32]PIZ91240.1 MAG: L-threonine 3-dehydrogenase [Candidatus Micrarchaeota archaeon CG_4_10_14_0_2_um_filter_60_11]